MVSCQNSSFRNQHESYSRQIYDLFSAYLMRIGGLFSAWIINMLPFDGFCQIKYSICGLYLNNTLVFQLELYTLPA